jgi:hypothetical protein
VIGSAANNDPLSRRDSCRHPKTCTTGDISPIRFEECGGFFDMPDFGAGLRPRGPLPHGSIAARRSAAHIGAQYEDRVSSPLPSRAGPERLSNYCLTAKKAVAHIKAKNMLPKIVAAGDLSEYRRKARKIFARSKVLSPKWVFCFKKSWTFCVRMRPTGPAPISGKDLTTPHPRA